MSTRTYFESFRGELFDQWRRDRALRQHIPLDQAWRGCLGIAALFDHPDDCECVGEKVLYPNDRISWLCLRDVPPGHFPGSASMNRREVNYVTRCRASLWHGMPQLDFASPEAAREGWDFRFFPLPEHVRRVSEHVRVLVQPRGDVLDPVANRREFGVLNQLSEAMTRFAFHATGAGGRPLRQEWARHRRECPGGPLRPMTPTQWIPRPYLAFPERLGERIFELATQPVAGTAAIECPSCRRRPHLNSSSEYRKCLTPLP